MVAVGRALGRDVVPSVAKPGMEVAEDGQDKGCVQRLPTLSWDDELEMK